jgi:hypothetical protein
MLIYERRCMVTLTTGWSASRNLCFLRKFRIARHSGVMEQIRRDLDSWARLWESIFVDSSDAGVLCCSIFVALGNAFRDQDRPAGSRYLCEPTGRRTMIPSSDSNIRFQILKSLTLLVLLPVLQSRGYAQVPPETTFFSTSAEEAYSTLQIPGGDGDLWPSCWADDDNLYTASGDGSAFFKSNISHDMSVSRISGALTQLSGTSLAKSVGTNWSGPGFDRKPTGMLCINSTLYLAFQNLDATSFNSAPAASIAKSIDYGNTWAWDATAPMFGGAGKPALFTTIFFLDYGKNSSEAIDQYVYAYGLDNNWRSQQALYLGRVPAGSVQTRSAWQFFTGTDASGTPIWISDITQKKPVLTDTRLLYPIMFGTDCPAQDAVIAQGGVVYDKPLQRYLFTSWSCSTHEIYEAPQPWGPRSHVLSNDFGPLRGLHNRGQYGTSIPSKFISRAKFSHPEHQAGGPYMRSHVQRAAKSLNLPKSGVVSMGRRNTQLRPTFIEDKS